MRNKKKEISRVYIRQYMLQKKTNEKHNNNTINSKKTQNNMANL